MRSLVSRTTYTKPATMHTDKCMVFILCIPIWTEDKQ